ncbi:MAG: hypothetical protein HZB55_21050 [Deltaproteobacteria bacterium]|nr:hypothetical protein [Deltaproteobacteria bacterium]
MLGLTDGRRTWKLRRCETLPEVGEPPALDPPSLVSSRLEGRVVRRHDLPSGTRRGMWGLLTQHFVNAERQRFDRDLDEKEWVVLLEDPDSGRLRGFSTIQRIEARIGGRPAVAYYSGDTIVQQGFWGERVLPILWSRHVFGLASAEPTPAYWFLISSGYKTYRFLPVFFREFYPRWDRPTPSEAKRLLDAFGRLKFSGEYDPARGVVSFAEPAPLRRGVADLTAGRLADPHVAFFAAANPGHERGDELACLTELCAANVTPAGRRALGLPRLRG